jgi:23S rRNA pseudouridine1911/1915/1917 synthase
MHQLRVQSAGRGWPVLGDRLYGSGRDFAPDAIALHARALTVRHPIDGHLLTIEAPVPDAWAEAGIDLDPPPVSSR